MNHLKFKLYLWVLVLTFGPATGVWSQGGRGLSASKELLEFEHLTREDGLPSNDVNDIFQDSYGFIWIGTNGGLVRYDGYELKVYKNDPNDLHSLSANNTTTIYEDRSKTLWIGTGIGLNKYDPYEETFTSYSLSETDTLSISDNFIKSIFEDQQGRFWVGTQGGLNLMDRDKGTFTHYLPDPNILYGFNSNSITEILQDPVQTEILWLGAAFNKSWYLQFNTSSRTFAYQPKFDVEGNNQLSQEIIYTLLKSKENEIWLGTANGLQLYIPEKGGFRGFNHDPDDSLSLSHNFVTTIWEDSEETLWIGTFRGGLNKFNKTSKTFYHYRHYPQDPKSLASDRISSILEDRSGRLWIGTFDNGISYVDRKIQKFKKIRPYAGAPNSSPSGPSVTAIYQDRSNTLWLGSTLQGLLFLDVRKNSFQGFQDEPDELNILGKLWIWSIIEDQQGILWLGTNRDGLYRFDPKNRSLKSYKNDPSDPSSLINNYVSSVVENDDGTLWIATFGGLQYLDRNTEKFHNIPLIEEAVERKIFGYLYKDQAKNIWVGSSSGLFCLNSKKEVILQLKHDPSNFNSLSTHTIYCITEDTRGNIWVGTSKGLNRIVFSKKENLPADNPTITRYTEQMGLAGNNVSSILEDDHGQLWVSTTNGLSLFKNPQHDEKTFPVFQNFSIKDGLQGHTFNNGAHFKNALGEMFFGGNKGLNQFYPDSIYNDPYLAPIVFSSFSYYDMGAPEKGATFIKGIGEKKEIELSYKNNIFSIAFAALSYPESHKNQYVYQLEGFSDSWINLGTRHDVTFTNLAPGTYSFRVKGSNHDGVWNENFAELKIRITPPWWKTWWAYLLYSVAFLSVIYFWLRYELNRRQLKYDLKIRQLEAIKLKELDQMKSRFFANISHEFRTPLTLILGPLNNLLNRTPQNEDTHHYGLMRRNALRLLRLINQLLDISKLEAGKMKLEAQYDDIIPMLRGMLFSFESLAQEYKVNMYFETMEEQAFLYFDPSKMEQIITNILANAFKFTGEGGIVSMRIKKADDFLRIDISDTGSGIKEAHLPYVFDRFYQGRDDAYRKDKHGSGIGLALTKELVELHHGRIEVSSRISEGTRFSLFLPFGNTHLQADEMVERKPIFPLPVQEWDLISDREMSAVEELPQETVVLTPVEGLEEKIVLLVEDNNDMRTFISSQFIGSYKVVEAMDGQAGVEKALQLIPDLIISDVMMPGLDGLQLCDALKNDQRTSHIPIILLTAKADIESRLAGLERGADAYLAKPFNSEELLIRSRKLLELRKRLRERYSLMESPPPTEEKDLQIEDAFLQKIREIVMERLSDSEFDMDQLSKNLGMSRSQIFRKIKALTGQSPSIFIRAIRLQEAKKLLQDSDMTISEVAYEVGFSTPAYFSDAFLEAYGLRPSEFRK